VGIIRAGSLIVFSDWVVHKVRVIKKFILWQSLEKNLFSFIKKRFLYRFILVYINNLNVNVHTYDIKNLKVLHQASEDFSLETADTFTKELVEYINKQQEEIMRSYVVSLLNSQGQGIIPTCSSSKFKKYHIDRRYIYSICINEMFVNYVTKIDVKWVQKTFAKTGIDLLFSPFTILQDIIFIENDTMQTVSYILQTNHTLTLMIAQDGKILYGSFFEINNDVNPLYCDYDYCKNDEDDEDEFKIDEEIDFENDFDDFDDFDDESIYEREVSLVEENKTFTKFLNNSLKEFYSNEIYNGNFVDKVKIYSEKKIDQSIIGYIENELFLQTEVCDIELDDLVLKFCKKEVIGV
jgi:hypothetical protein